MLPTSATLSLGALCIICCSNMILMLGLLLHNVTILLCGVCFSISVAKFIDLSILLTWSYRTLTSFMVSVCAVFEGRPGQAKCSLFLWICHYSSHSYSEVSYLSSYKAAGKCIALSSIIVRVDFLTSSLFCDSQL